MLSALVWKVCKFQGESLSSLWLITCWKYHIALFSLYEFFLLGFSYKVFNEAISTQNYVLSSIFPIEVFWWMILEHTIHCTLFFMWGFPVEVSHLKFLMRQCQQRYMLYHLVFPHRGFWKMLYQGVIRLRLWVCLKGSNNIGDCISWSFSLFFPIGFWGVLPDIPVVLWFFP